MTERIGVSLKYYYKHNRHWTICQNLDDAVSTAYWMEHYDNRVGDEVVSLDGEILIDSDSLTDLVLNYAKNVEPIKLESGVTEKSIPFDNEDHAAASLFSEFMGLIEVDYKGWANLPDNVKTIWRAKVNSRLKSDS